MSRHDEDSQTGLHNSRFGLETHGFRNVGKVFWNLPEANLFEAATRREEGEISCDGALVVKTGVHTGRSAQDKFVVAHSSYEKQIWWDNNKRMDPAAADRLFSGMMSYAQGRDLFVQDLYGGADPEHKISVRVVTEYAWHSLFIRNLLIRPARAELAEFIPEFLIVDLPGFQAVPERHGCRSETVIACDFEKRIILIGGTSYAGEIKKSVFTILNYLLPGRGTMPMHCSANVGRNGEDPAIFFGLSGTGKTTLSADPDRILIGDDEHGWSKNGIFNFEGGCYAKMINLSPTAEPEIFAATQRFGTILENVVMDPATRQLDFNDGSLTQNTRGAYPIHYIPNASQTGQTGHPKNVIMLTCDAFGVMPPLAKMTPDQAMFHFLSGYTAKVAGTEKGVTEPEATFSTCFGAPFMPRHPSEYGNLLRELIAKHEVQCWLVNTGWTGGPYGTGSRMPIKETRALLSAALNGAMNGVEMREDRIFGFGVPTSVPDVDPGLLDPRGTWSDASAFDQKARELANRFVANFDPFEAYVDDSVKRAAPDAS